MSDAWFVERSQSQSGQPQVGVASMNSVFWGPVGEINFNPQNIVFSTRLKNSSQIVTAMQNPSALQQQQGGTGTTPSTLPSPSQPGVNSTTTAK